MTKEEKQKAIDALKISAPIMCITQEKFYDYIQILNTIIDWLEQEPYKVSEYDKDHIWYRGVQYISLRRFLEAKSEEKAGHWISHREHCEKLGVIPSGLGFYEWCSNCDCGIDVMEWQRNNYNYCPNCGARMFESQE